MFSIAITERGGAQRRLDFDAPELSIGRVEDNDVVLPRSNVSKRHAQLVLKDERYVLIDLKSTNGTYVNGRRIAAPTLVTAGDKIYIGDFILSVLEPTGGRLNLGRPVQRTATVPAPAPALEGGEGSPSGAPSATRRSLAPPPLPSVRPPGTLPPAPPSTPPAPQARQAPPSDEGAPAERQRPTGGPPAPRPSSIPPPRLQDPLSDQGPATSPAVLAPSVRLQGALQTLMERLAVRMDVSEPRERAFPVEQQRALDAMMDDLAAQGVTGPDLDRRFLVQAAISEAVGLGPLDRLLNNRSVREVVIDGPSRILADVGGGLSPVSSFFSSSRALHDTLRRLFARAGKQLGSGPTCEAQLPDGTRVQVLLPPLSPSGPLVCLRCPPRGTVSAEALVTEGVLSLDMLALLRAAVQRKLNVLVVGPSGAGVSTMLSALASLCQDHERIAALQQSPSLAISHPHVLALSLGGEGLPGLGEVLRHALRLRPDRVVLDDLQATDALSILNAGSLARGMLVGMHAPSPAAALEQLELFGQVALGGAAHSLASLITQAFSLLVHVGHDPMGVRRVLALTELRGAQGSALSLSPLFRHDGGFRATENRPSFA